MRSCTTCQAELDDAAMKAGQCPLCGTPTVERTPHTVQDPRRLGTNLSPDPSSDGTGEDSSAGSLEHQLNDSSPSDQTASPNNATVELSPDDTAADLGPLTGNQGKTPPNASEGEPAEDETDTELSKKATHPVDRDMTIDIAELAEESNDFKATTDGVIHGEGALSASDIEKLSSQWHNTYNADSSTGQTIRQPKTASAFRSSLPIKSRNIQESSARKSGDPKQLPSSEVPDYELLNVIGEGGMGVVFSATQSSIARTVAVKMLKPNKRKDEEQHDKFISEAVVTGELDHPNIVPIYDLGTNESGALFYSMKRVRGTPWDDVIKEKSLDENLNILLRVADAVAFAHAHGVVHRDLKPDNVMLGDYGEVLVMDWGLAQVTKDFANIEAIYQAGSLGGTPAYMSPEMARGPIEAIDFRSDVYLLGAILYEIIGGHPPHSGRDVMQCLLAATQNQIDPIKYEGELKSISMRAMALNREDRYASIKELQDAIGMYQSHSESLMLTASSQHHLEKARQTTNYDTYARAVFGFQEALQLWDGNEKARTALVEAQFDYASCAYYKGDFDLAATLLNSANETHAELLSKIEKGQQERDARQWRLRNFRRIVAALVVAIAGISILAAVLINRNRQEAVHQKRIAEENEREAVRQKTLADKAKDAEEYEAYIARIGLAAAKIDENAYDYAFELLGQCHHDLRHWEWGRLAHLCQLSELPMQADGPVDAVAYSPLGDQCVSGDWDGQVAIRDISDGKVIHSLQHGQYVHAVAYSPSGKFIASGSSDSTIRLIDARTGLEIRTLPGKAQGVGHQDAVLSLQFSPDGKQLITTSYDESARLWDLQSGSELQVLRGHSWWVWDAEFSPDGKQLVTVGQDGRAIIWKRTMNQDNTFGPFEKITEFPGHEGPVYAADFSNDGQLVATGGYDNKVLVWNPNEVQPIDIGRRIENLPDPKPTHLELSGHNGPVRSVAFSPTNSTLLVSGSHDNTLQIWNVATGNLVKIFRGHGGSVRSCAFSPDGLKVLSGAHDEFVRLWNIEGYQEKRVIRGRVLKGHTDAVLSAQFSPDGTNIVTASRDRTASLWDVATGKQIREFNEGHQFLASNIAFFDNGRKLVTGGGDNSVRIWDVITGTQLLPISPTGRMGTIAISPDGSQIVTGSAGNEIQVWDTTNGSLLATLTGHTAEVTSAVFSSNGNYLVTGDDRGGLRVWQPTTDARRFEFLRELHAHTRSITATKFLPNDTRLITASGDMTCTQWDIATGKIISGTTLRHPDWVTSLDISQDGQLAITTCEDGIVRLWSVPNAKEIQQIALPELGFNSARIAPVGTAALLTSAKQKKLQIWRFGNPESQDTTTNLLDFNQVGGSVWSAAFSPNGEGIVTIGGNDARLWDLATGRQQIRFSPHGAVAAATLSHDGRYLVTGSWDNSAKIWDSLTGKAIRRLDNGHTGYINSAEFSSDGNLVLTASDDGTARLWNFETGKLTDIVLQGHGARLFQAVFSPDGKRILTVSGDKTARLWDAATGHEQLVLKGHQWAVTCGQFSRNGKSIITGSEDNSAKIWDAHTGTLQNTLVGHTSGVTAVAFSPDGQRALTGSQDNTAKLWDPYEGKEILSLAGHEQEVTAVAFSPDGQLALTGSRDGTAIIWLAIDWQNLKPLAALSRTTD